MPSDSGFPSAAYDRWLAKPYEEQEEVTLEDCAECDGQGFIEMAALPKGGMTINAVCDTCEGNGQREVTPEELNQRAADEAASIAEDNAMERYYDDKYVD